MGDMGDALEGAIALVCGGFIFLLFASAIPTGSPIDFSFWGITYIVVGSLVAIVLVAAVISKVVTRGI